MTKVYCISMFDAGDGSPSDPFHYWNFFPGFLRAFYSCFPGWELWIYHDSSLYHAPHGDTLMRLAHAGKLKLIYAGDTHQRCRGMLWRMRPIWEGADIVACRDIDALPYPREFKTVEEWIKNPDDKIIGHCIHDSESHHGIMGGTATWRSMQFRDIFKSWDDLVNSCIIHKIDLSIHGGDQHLLNKVIPRSRVTFIRNPPKEDTRDHIGPHIGAGFSSSIISDWYDRNEFNPWLRKCERAYSETSVVMGCDGHHNYVGGLPLTCKVWNELNNSRALVIMAGDKEELIRKNKYQIDWMRDAGARIFFTPIAAGYRPATTAQVGRLFAHLIPWIDGNRDYLLTSDADMWPLSADWFARNKAPDKLSLWYANAYAGKQYPLCYAGAFASIWKDIMGGDKFAQALASSLVGIPDKESMSEWCFDEVYFSAQVKKWNGFPVRAHLVDRRGGPPIDRIDRSRWPVAIDIKGMVDAHLVRPVEKQYDKVRSILVQLMTPEALAWCDNYQKGCL